METQQPRIEVVRAERTIAERIGHTAICMLAGVGIIYVCEIFQIAGRIQAATAEGFEVSAYDAPTPRKPSR